MDTLAAILTVASEATTMVTIPDTLADIPEDTTRATTTTLEVWAVDTWAATVATWEAALVMLVAPHTPTEVSATLAPLPVDTIKCIGGGRRSLVEEEDNEEEEELILNASLFC